MPQYKRLSDDDRSLAADLMQAAIKGQKLIVAKLISGAPEHQQLVDTQRSSPTSMNALGSASWNSLPRRSVLPMYTDPRRRVG